MRSFGFGLDSNANNGFGEFHAFKHDRLVGVAQRVARCGVFESYERAYVARENLFDFGAVVRVHHKNTPYALFLVLGAVQHVRTGRKRAGIATEERKFTHKRVCHNLERKSRERCGIAGFALFHHVAVHKRAFNGRNVERRRHVVHDSVQKFLYALVLERTAARNGIDFHGDCKLADCLFDFRHRKVGALVFKVSLHESVVRFGNHFE